MGAALARQHAGYDARRFVFPEPLEAAHATFFAAQLATPEAVVLVAEAPAGGLPGGGAPAALLGYAFARREPASFVDALPASGWVHDLYVAPGARGAGAGGALLDAAVAALGGLGAGPVLLTVAAANPAARRLFERRGLAVTMHEMTLTPGPRAAGSEPPAPGAPPANGSPSPAVS